MTNVVLTDCGGYVRMEYVIDADFMDKEVYPVTIDSVVHTTTTNAAVCDSYIWLKSPNTNYGSVYLMRCGDGEGEESISLIEFNKLIKLRASDTVLSAQLRVTASNYYSADEVMGCYPIKTGNLWYDVIYNFGYDALGRKTTVKVGSKTLSTSVYNSDRSGLLKEVQYGNGGKVAYQYDKFDRPYAAIHDDKFIFNHTYEYDAAGRPAWVNDIHAKRKVQSEYDQCDRLMGMQIRDVNDEVIYRTEMDCDVRTD